MEIQSKHTVRTAMVMLAALAGLSGCMGFFTEESAMEPDSLREGLVACYSFNGDAEDSSGNGIHGTVHGAKPAEDLGGNPNSAYLFDGIDDYILFGHGLPDMEEMTVCAWILAENEVNFFNDADWAAGNDVTLGAGPRSVRIRADKGRDNLWEEPHVGVEMHNRWRHVAWTLTPAESKIYVDGSCCAAAGRGGTNTGYHHFILGTHEYPRGRMGFGGCFKGRISSLRIYSRVLSEEEIKMISEID